MVLADGEQIDAGAIRELYLFQQLADALRAHFALRLFGAQNDLHKAVNANLHNPLDEPHA
jgi:hypothetical protein